MDLKRLSAKQKRVKDWTLFLDEWVQDEELRSKIVDKVKIYRNLLAKCWEVENVSQEDMVHLEDLERQLEQLNNEARLRAYRYGTR